MSVSPPTDNKSKRRKSSGDAALESRRNAVKDATPDTQPAWRIKKIRKKDDEHAAETDEEDD
jgi:hypothetical protein